MQKVNSAQWKGVTLIRKFKLLKSALTRRQIQVDSIFYIQISSWLYELEPLPLRISKETSPKKMD